MSVIDLKSRKDVKREMKAAQESGGLDPERRQLTPTQRAFATSLEPFPALIGGYGSGKSAAGIARAMALKSHFRDTNVAYYLPTYPLVEDIAFEKFPELCERKGWAYKLRKSGGSPHIEFPGAGRILFRTMEHPERIVGYDVGHSVVDEIDILDIKKATKAWTKIIARNRSRLKGGARNTVAVVTTPEGFKFVYQRWHKNKKPGYVYWKASTYDNQKNLPEHYIEDLLNTYPANVVQAYLYGEFVNMTAGSVYPMFNRIINFSRETVQKGDALHIGMDFNVMKMAAIVHVMRAGKPHAVKEFVNIFDTPAMIKTIKETYPGYAITIWPDQSAKGRESVNASTSDIALLQQANWTVMTGSQNPRVKDRVLAMNKQFELGNYKVNPDTCPTYTECLEQQAYDDNGEPDKKAGFDHPNDAGGYFIVGKYPIVKPAMTINLGTATNG